MTFAGVTIARRAPEILCRCVCRSLAARTIPASAFSEITISAQGFPCLTTYRVFGFGLWAVCLKATGEMIGDCGLTMQLIGGEIKPEIGYHIRGNMQRKGYAKEAAIAVRDWTFHNTPFNTVYSHMKHTNEPSYKTAISYGCKQVDEYKDDENEITKVFAITREEWINRYTSI